MNLEAQRVQSLVHNGISYITVVSNRDNIALIVDVGQGKRIFGRKRKQFIYLLLKGRICQRKTLRKRYPAQSAIVFYLQ